MLDLRSFLKQSSIYTISTFLSRAITLLLIPFYTRVLSPADYGAVDILTVSCTLINLTIAFEVHQAIARFYNEWEPDKRLIYISTAFIFTIFIYTIFSFLMYPFRSWLAGYFLEDITKTEVIVATLFMAWTSGLYYFTQSQLRWQLKAKAHAITSVVFTIATTLLTILLVLQYNLGVLGVIYGLVLGNAVGVVLSLYYARNSYGLVFKFEKLVEMLKFSTPLVLSSVSVFFSMYIDRIMIKDMLSLTDLGLFSIGYKFASIVGLLMVGVNSAITPLIYTHYNDPTTPKQLSKIFTMFSFVAMILFVGISIMSAEIISIFTTEAYAGASLVIPYLIMTTLLASLYNFTPGLFIAKKTKIIASINIITAIINIILNILLIPIWGIQGACIATLCGYLISFLMYYFYNQKYYPISFNWNRTSLVLVFSLVTISLASLLPELSIALSIIFKIGVLTLYSILSFLLIADEKLRKRITNVKLLRNN